MVTFERQDDYDSFRLAMINGAPVLNKIFGKDWHYFFGLYSKEPGNLKTTGWIWYATAADNLTYPWHVGQPDDYNNVEWCMDMWCSGGNDCRMNDLPCNSFRFASICQDATYSSKSGMKPKYI